ncbi:MAG: hypothetical protein MJZ34_11010 [Paludibacteraceae bacterium]|nr:hypothetical protein [Paludibacteraceae bacterium]
MEIIRNELVNPFVKERMKIHVWWFGSNKYTFFIRDITEMQDGMIHFCEYITLNDILSK